MDYYKKITIYGSNTDILENGRSVKTPLINQVLALADIETFEVDVVSVDAEPSYNSTTIKKWDFSTFIRNRIFWSAKPTGIERDFETENNNFEDYFGTETISKEFLWVHIPDYVLMPKGMDNTKVLAICISGASVAHKHENGTKSLSFNIVGR